MHYKEAKRLWLLGCAVRHPYIRRGEWYINDEPKWVEDDLYEVREVVRLDKCCTNQKICV